MADETNPANWKKGEVVYTATDSTRFNGNWQVKNANIPAGHYEIEISNKDRENDAICTGEWCVCLFPL